MTAPQCLTCPRLLRKRTGQPGYVGAHRRCGSCDERWRRAGCPEDGPPPPMTAMDRTARSSRTLHLARLNRLAEYTRLRAAGFSVAQAAGDVGVALKTAQRTYEPHYWRERTGEGPSIPLAAPSAA